MKGVSAFLAAAVISLGIVAGAPAAHADDPDPSVFLGSSLTASNGSAFSTAPETLDSWLYPSSGVSVAGDTNTTYVSFLNDTGTPWSAITIVATMDSTSGHTFNCDTGLFPAHGDPVSQAFSSCTAPNPGSTSTTETFTFSSGSIANGDYLVFTWNDFPTNSGKGPLNFQFTATPGTAATPEPGTLALFGSGLLGIAGLIRRKVRL